jgi:hypothetical protein
MPHPDIGHTAQHGSSGIGRDELCALFNGPCNLSAYDGMGGCRVTAYDENASSLSYVRNGVCHGATAQSGSQTGYRRRVSEASAVVDIVGLHNDPDKFLKEIVFFIGALGRRKASKLVSFVMNQGTGYVLDRLLPVDLNKFSFPFDKGGC